jgi:hypothetical protein
MSMTSKEEYQKSLDIGMALSEWFHSQDVSMKQATAAMIMLSGTIIGKTSATRAEFDERLQASIEYLTKYAKLQAKR